MKEFDAVLPSEVYNTIYIFVTILLLLWFFKASKRFYRAIQIRRAVITDSLVQIQGLGSYLSYFDGATQSHLHSIVHTRQTKPPVDMPLMYVPCSIRKCQLLAVHRDRSTIELNLHSTVPGKLLILTNFSLSKFRSAVYNASARRRNNFFLDTPNANLRDILFSMDQQHFHSVSDALNHSLSYLSEQQCCDLASSKEEVVKGSQTIRLTFQHPNVLQSTTNDARFHVAIAFLPTTTENVTKVRAHAGDLIRDKGESVDRNRNITNNDRDESASESASVASVSNLNLLEKEPKFSFGNLFSYFSPSRHTYESAPSPTNSNRLVHPAANADSDGNRDDDNLESGNAPSPRGTTNRSMSGNLMLRKSEVANGNIYVFQFPLKIRSLFENIANSTPSSPSDDKRDKDNNGRRRSKILSKEVYPKDLILMDKLGKLYTSQEIFGLGGVEGGSSASTANAEDGSKAKAVDISPASPPARNVSTTSQSKALVGEGDIESSGNATKQSNSEEPTATQSTRAVFQGGKFVREDCVVCLTDPQSIMLLPCRHLCVCSSCLTYVDKCPVCRAFFEEYIMIQQDNTIGLTSI